MIFKLTHFLTWKSLCLPVQNIEAVVLFLSCFMLSIILFDLDSIIYIGQVIQRVKVRVKTDEDVWALKIMNFIQGANQLLFDGLTREMPL